MTCTKCGSHSFWWDAEDGWACSACRKPYGSPWPPPGPEAELARIEIKRFTWADRRRAVAAAPIVKSGTPLEIPSPVCQAELIPGVEMELCKWPSWWARIWHWVFFGVVWKPYKP